MNLQRRRFLHLAASAAAVPAMARVAEANAYPVRPVRLIVGYPPGGAADIVARLIGQWLSERLGQSFVVENRPGVGSVVATETVVNALPDGYALLLSSTANTIGTSLYDKLNYNFIRDIAPVAIIARAPGVMEVHPSVPAKTVPEFIAYAKAHPAKLNFASSGVGSFQYVSGELFKMIAGVDMIHVPYRGAAPALADLVGGQVQVMFDTLPSSIEHIRAGRLRPLAVTAAARTESLPDIPTVGDFLPGYETSTWWGIAAPRNTPAEIVTKLNTEINASLADPQIKARLADLGSVPTPMTSAEFGKFVAEETKKWAEVVRFSGAKAD